MTSSPGLPEPSSYPGAKDSLSFTAGASGSETVTVTSTVSLEPSGYVTTTGTVILSPGLAPSGTLTLMEPSSLTVTPSGAPSPGANFVPSGAVVGLPSLSLKVGAGTFTSSPGLPEPSSYPGAKDSLSFTTVGSARNESARRSVPVGLPEASAANTWEEYTVALDRSFGTVKSQESNSPSLLAVTVQTLPVDLPSANHSIAYF